VKVSLWAEIHRLADIVKLSRREIAIQLHCSRETVSRALTMTQPPAATENRRKRASKLDPYKAKIKEILEDYPRLSGQRIGEEIRKLGYTGGSTILRDYLQSIRGMRKRVYQPVDWKPGDAMQVDWGDCGKTLVGATERKVSVFVAALCYSRMLYIEFTLDQRKETFYRCIINALQLFGGSPRRIIVDNLKAAVVSGHGRKARFHPEFLDICGYYRLQVTACQRRDPESKGIVESGVRFVKHNALAGCRLESWEEYSGLSEKWLSKVNLRPHRSTGERPIDRLAREELLPLPEIAYDTRKVCQCVVNSHAHVIFETNRYSVPPENARQAVTLKASDKVISIYFLDREIARHIRSYERKKLIIDPIHRRAALAHNKRESDRNIEARFGDLGVEAALFVKGLRRSPCRPVHHMKVILNLLLLYDRHDVIKAIEAACTYQTFDAAYVENLIQQNRRRLSLPSPLPLSPVRKELFNDFDLDEPDPGFYDQLIGEDDENKT